ncbi:MAG: heme NO-binding domain-containing protein [Gammaproteobacteria bacterium]|nr:heme NO-binding domain-containing protein [Gammaproteobacteria bacterium]
MKGVVFTTFNKMIEEKFGMDVWDELIEKTQPESGGVYTSSDTYPDEELYAYIGELSKMTGAEVPDLIRTFGGYKMQQLHAAYPDFFKDKSIKEFLKSVHGYIHVEVKKLYPKALLPDFEYEDPAPDELIMIYRSERKLCVLAEGLIGGASEVFKTAIDINHAKCMHRGDDHCRLELKIGAPNGNTGTIN